jgi:two-component system KDP operon response regulator KdpE
MTPARILIVEDDDAIRTALVAKLGLDGHAVTAVADGLAAQRAVESAAPDLVLLDLMLPGLDGLSVLRWIRRRDKKLPVLIISARGREEQKVEGLRAGADDYLAKPFGLDELSARIDALLRRALGAEDVIRAGDLEIDLAAERVRRGGDAVELSPTEWRLLHFLVLHPGAAHSRERIRAAVWEDPGASDLRAVDYHVMHLRRKLEEDPAEPRHLLTRHGRGYEWAGDAGGG